ncbi:hypothetical protein B0H66DRAFT_608468 [Apodospora peruviana]|uniref:ShKT domain-containing protein n=1 Tax=Apodospora peruviana TaxID=516989 RepID=A0AAE0HT23_9PEZI|nr:hypothetical protein B0H66DRAFT_608468 [Apodospora peruviana]
MKFYGILAAALAMMVSTAVAQPVNAIAARDECQDTCNAILPNCLAHDGTKEYCEALRDSCLSGCP